MADDIIALVRRFEPVLHFHNDERFFPSDAEKYMQQCALWRAERPLDQKDSWGGKGTTFPRQAMIEQYFLATSDDPAKMEPGNIYIGQKVGTDFPFLTNNSTEERFLTYNGWVDGEGNVDATTDNRHAALDIIESFYAGTPDLALSTFYYHAEVFTTERLRRLMVTPDLVDLDFTRIFLDLLPRNPALICYYLFYPGHDEPLPPPCDADANGKAYASFAGDWQCVAILVDREDETKPYMPRWIGRTGRFNAGTRQGLDAERRIGMTVSKWREQTDVHQKPLPELLGEHPKLWVSRGVHSLYLEPGTREIVPYLPEEMPVGCGFFDSPDALQEFKDTLPPEEEDGSPAAAWGKVLAGLALGGLPGLMGGAALTALEGLSLDISAKGVGTVDFAANSQPVLDTVAEQDEIGGMIVGPPGFPATNFRSWNLGRNGLIEDPDHQFIVDRTKQIWWPSDDDQSGYRGRWGPLVVDDPFKRRSGMRFPKFWKMFFVGLAKSM